VPRRAGDRDPIRLKLTREGGGVVADAEMPVKEARKGIRTTGVVTLLVFTVRLVAGEYRPEVRYRRDDVNTQLLKSHFKLDQR